MRTATPSSVEEAPPQERPSSHRVRIQRHRRRQVAVIPRVQAERVPPVEGAAADGEDVEVTAPLSIGRNLNVLVIVPLSPLGCLLYLKCFPVCC